MAIADLGNLKLNYIQINPQVRSENCEDLIMIHGLATSSAFWYPVANNLILKNSQGNSIKTRITLFDLPGHGRSSMPKSGYTSTSIAHQLNELVKFLNLDQFHVIAHSFGGSVALDFAHQFRDRVKSLVLADVRLKILQPQQLLQNWQNWQKLREKLAKLNINLAVERPEAGIRLLTAIAQWQVNQSGQSNLENHNLTDLIPLKQNIQMARKWLKLLETTEAMTEITETELITIKEIEPIKVPKLLIYGDNSPNLTTKNELEKIWKLTNSYLVPNAGHFFPLSRPNIFIEQISKFFQNIIN